MQISMSLFPCYHGLDEMPRASVHVNGSSVTLMVTSIRGGQFNVMCNSVGDIIAFGQSIVDQAKALEAKV